MLYTQYDIFNYIYSIINSKTVQFHIAQLFLHIFYKFLMHDCTLIFLYLDNTSHTYIHYYIKRKYLYIKEKRIHLI